MSDRTRFLNKSQLTRVNRELEEAGYRPYAGDRTTVHPTGSGSGYVMNLLNDLAPNQYAEQEKIQRIIDRALSRSAMPSRRDAQG